METATITPHPTNNNAALISFTERYRAEQFFTGSTKDITHIGKCELSWAINALAPAAGVTAVSGNGNGISSGSNGTIGGMGTGGGDAETDISMTGQGQVTSGEGEGREREAVGRGDVDYDVADDDERWLVG